ncbi:MAG: T9SS type A sorting domain-containing protein [Bacteroidota bacterium]
MKKSLLLVLVLALCASWATAQQVIYDFEGPSTTTNFQYFGSSLEPQTTTVIANPNPTGINMSDSVAQYVKAANAMTWAGAFSNPDPDPPIDVTSGGEICIDVHMENIGNLAFKLESGVGGAPNWILTVANTRVNEWEQLCFDLSAPSEEPPFEPASGGVYGRAVIYFDFGVMGGMDDATYFMDNVVYNPGSGCSTLYNFEDTETTTDFQYFGSSLEPQLTSVIANPNPTSVNMSDSVVQYVKAANSQVWAGAFANPAPSTPIAVNSGTQICVDVHYDRISNLAIKLEQGMNDAPDWVITVPNTVVNEWETLCFDVSTPSEEAPFEPAAGSYTAFVIFPNFQANDTVDVTYYLDNIVVCTSSVPPVDVVFSVDMSEYTESFDGVNVRGEFNNFSEDNPLTDQGNGLWTGTVSLTPGIYEYKFWLSGADVWEEFTGLETCVTPPGAYVNRVVTVTSETSGLDTICFNSCYACGDEVQISIELGMGDSIPSPDGVWLAGGGNFENPGGRFKMDDSDGDGIYTISFPRQRGFTSYYTFANGNCPGYECKEDIAGQACADPDNFNDRQMVDVTEDLTIATCFGLCADNTNCEIVSTRDLTVDNSLFSIAPNPANEFTLLQFNNRTGEELQLSLFNTLGQRLLSTELDGWTNTYQLDMQNLNSGIYWIHVQVGNTIANQKIVKR